MILIEVGKYSGRQGQDEWGWSVWNRMVCLRGVDFYTPHNGKRLRVSCCYLSSYAWQISTLFFTDFMRPKDCHIMMILGLRRRAYHLTNHKPAHKLSLAWLVVSWREWQHLMLKVCTLPSLDQKLFWNQIKILQMFPYRYSWRIVVTNYMLGSVWCAHKQGY